MAAREARLFALLKYWDVVRSWSEQSRYARHPPESAQAIIEAVGDRKSWSHQMVQALLVSVDLDTGTEILRILDEANLKVSVALWVLLEEYSHWRLLLAAHQFDTAGPLEAHGLVNDALRAAGFPIGNKPSILILPMRDPTVSALRRLFGKAKSVEGMRLGGQQIGRRWVEDGYVYRIS